LAVDGPLVSSTSYDTTNKACPVMPGLQILLRG
jgi:hypothetical protein